MHGNILLAEKRKRDREKGDGISEIEKSRSAALENRNTSCFANPLNP